MAIGPDDDPVFTTIWYDVGGTTGWALFSIWQEAMHDPAYKILGNVAAWSCGVFEGDENEQTDAMVEMAKVWPEAVVGYEDFIVRQLGGRDMLSPVRLGARLEDRFYLMGRKLAVPQMPSLAMSKVTDERLVRWGLEPRCTDPQRHDADAVRHCITYLARRKEANLREQRAKR